MRKFLIVLTIVLIILSIYFGNLAYDVKNNYYMSSTGIYSKNAFVVGDAYNYIINSNYFTAFTIAASACGLGALTCLLFIFGYNAKEEQHAELLIAIERKEKYNG